MSVTINTDMVIFILCVIACIALVFLVIALKKLSTLIESIDNLIRENQNNVGLTIAKLPSIAEKVDSTVDNAKDVTDVAVDMAGDILTAKNKLKSGITTSVDVAKIIKNTMKK